MGGKTVRFHHVDGLTGAELVVGRPLREARRLLEAERHSRRQRLVESGCALEAAAMTTR